MGRRRTKLVTRMACGAMDRPCPQTYHPHNSLRHHQLSQRPGAERAIRPEYAGRRIESDSLRRIRRLHLIVPPSATFKGRSKCQHWRNASSSNPRRTNSVPQRTHRTTPLGASRTLCCRSPTRRWQRWVSESGFRILSTPRGCDAEDRGRRCCESR
jgi:hypothetical protein